MMKIDVTRDVAGSQDAEKITIRLEVDGKCICVESQETGHGGRIIRFPY